MVSHFLRRSLRTVLPYRSRSNSSRVDAVDGERFFQYYLVAFIDILGQQRAFDGIESLPGTPADQERLGLALRSTVGLVENFRDGFADFFKTFSGATEALDLVPKERREEFRNMSKREIDLHVFSDLVMAEVSLMGCDKSPVAVNSVCGVLAASGAMMLLSLMAGHAVRGGIDIGLGIRLKSGEVYGPVLNSAYELENKVAQYPRLVAGPGLVRFLKAMRDQPPSTVEARVSIRGAELALGTISTDHDGQPILDYLSQGFRKIFTEGPKALGKPAADLDGWVSKAFDFVKAEREKWERAENRKLASRYQLLEDYFRSRI
jgi:hypothetical protein